MRACATFCLLLAAVACEGTDNADEVDGDDAADAGADADADADADTDADTDSDTDTDTDTDSDTDPWIPPESSEVWVQTEDTLYVIDPDVSSDLVEVGAFTGPCASGSGMYDIAVNEEGEILGIAAEALYSIDPETAACATVLEFPDGSPHFFSLSYVKGFDPLAPEMDVLVAASAEDGAWVAIDPAGATEEEIFQTVGYHDEPDHTWVSSGDIVSIQVGPEEFVTYATLKCATGYGEPGCESDMLAEIDPVTGAATAIGLTGYQQIFGLGFWGTEVYGVNNDGELLLIDVDTGMGTVLETYAPLKFWGAGTTTVPHVVPE